MMQLNLQESAETVKSVILKVYLIAFFKTAVFALDVLRLEKFSLISAVFAHLESQAELFQIFAQTVRVISCVTLFS